MSKLKLKSFCSLLLKLVIHFHCLFSVGWIFHYKLNMSLLIVSRRQSNNNLYESQSQGTYNESMFQI